jgi:urease accessory protein
MRSRIEIVAEYRAGRTVVTGIRGGGHYAGRETGQLGTAGVGGLACVVHLVGTAAGPLGGDDVTISVKLGRGARLALRSAGATIVQPGRQRPDSKLRMLLEVADEAFLDVACEPTVICSGATHEAEAAIELAGSGQVRLVEQVLLGRSNEPGGVWSGRTALTRDDTPILRHRLRSEVLAGARVISTLLHSGVEASPATVGSAVAMPLAAGGLLVSATGTALLSTQKDLLAAAALAQQPAIHQVPTTIPS